MSLPFENLRAVSLVERSNHDRKGLLFGRDLMSSPGYLGAQLASARQD